LVAGPDVELSVLVLDADGDEAELAEVAECDLAEGVNLVQPVIIADRGERA
jgi:hypothetical protein